MRNPLFAVLLAVIVALSGIASGMAGASLFFNGSAARIAFSPHAAQVLPHHLATASRQSLAGTYRCWQFNVSGSGGRCTSPALVLRANGTYQIGSERGTYRVSGNTIRLSKSRIRGAGRIEGDGMRIVFQYSYKGRAHTVTYLRRNQANEKEKENRVAPGKPVEVNVTILYPPEDKSGTWVNTAAIIAEGETYGPEVLALTDGKQTVTAWFRSVPTGRVYTIYTSTGFERRAVGTVDLRNVGSGPVNKTIHVAPPSVSPSPQSSASASAPAASPALTSPKPKCNPLIPRYSQPPCDE